MTLRRAQTMAEIASADEVDRVYVGEGGDEVFAENMLEPMSVRGAPPSRALLGPAWSTVQQTRHVVGVRPELLRRSLFTFIHDTGST